jgi:hypothetical protein
MYMELNRHDVARVVSRYLNIVLGNHDRSATVLSYTDQSTGSYAEVWVNPSEDRLQVMWTVGREDKDHSERFVLSDVDSVRHVAKHYAEAVRAIQRLP